MDTDILIAGSWVAPLGGIEVSEKFLCFQAALGAPIKAA